MSEKCQARIAMVCFNSTNMIRDIDAGISNTGELLGRVVLEGPQVGVERRFLQPNRSNAVAYGIAGLTGPETAVEFHTKPPQFGIDRLHELIVDQGAIPEVQRKWGQQIYPALARRLDLS